MTLYYFTIVCSVESDYNNFIKHIVNTYKTCIFCYDNMIGKLNIMCFKISDINELYLITQVQELWIYSVSRLDIVIDDILPLNDVYNTAVEYSIVQRCSAKTEEFLYSITTFMESKYYIYNEN